MIEKTQPPFRQSPVDVITLPLPPDAATKTAQDIANALLALIEKKLPDSVTPDAESGALTNVQLRAVPVPVSLASVPAHAVTGPVTDAQMRATPVPVSGTMTVFGVATETTLSAVGGVLVSILAKLIAAPATEAKQDTLIGKDFATQTTLAAMLAKLIAAPATEAKQDTLIAKDFATQTTLAAVLAKIIAAPATEAKQDAANTAVSSIDNKLTRPGTVTTTSVDLKTVNDATRNLILLAANANRKAAEIVNDTELAIRFSEGGVASLYSYSGIVKPKSRHKFDYPAPTVAINAYLPLMPENGTLAVIERS